MMTVNGALDRAHADGVRDAQRAYEQALDDAALLVEQGFLRLPTGLYVDMAGEGHVVTYATALRWARKDRAANDAAPAAGLGERSVRL